MNAAEELEDYVKAATVWSLGQIGRHTPEHAKAVAFANVFPKILACYMKTGGNTRNRNELTMEQRQMNLYKKGRER